MVQIIIIDAVFFLCLNKHYAIACLEYILIVETLRSINLNYLCFNT